MTALADNGSSMPLWPVWFWLLVIVLILVAAVLFWASHPNAAPAQETPATAQVPATTNPECSLFGHAVYRFDGEPVWLCRRIGCGEAWFVLPEQEPYDQAAEELVAETEAFLRKGGAA